MFLFYQIFIISIFFHISENKWVEIFNGKNLDGWEIKIRGHKVNDNFNNTFKVKNGVLEVSYNAYDQFDDKFGHNAEPIFKGTCCDECNMIFVIPARLEGMSEF